jgi:hypothetical protein
MRDDEVKKGGVLSFTINSQLRASALTVRALVRCSRRKLAVEVKIPVATAPEALVGVWTDLHIKTTTRMQITHMCSPFLFSELVGAQLANALATLRWRLESRAPLCNNRHGRNGCRSKNGKGFAVQNLYTHVTPTPGLELDLLIMPGAGVSFLRKAVLMACPGRRTW